MKTSERNFTALSGKGDDFLYCVFSEKYELHLPENSLFQHNYLNLQLNSKEYKNSKLVHKDSERICLENCDNYGSAAGLYWVWKNTNYPYIGFSLTKNILDVTEEEWEKFKKSKGDVLMKSHFLSICPLQENYRTLYYSYDFQMMMSVLKKLYPVYYSFAREKVIYQHKFIEATCVIKKEALRKFCVWLFPILEKCKEHLNDKYSKHQNRYLEHLSYYLFMIYFLYHEKKLKIHYVENLIPMVSEQERDSKTMNFANMKAYIRYLWEEREIEVALQHLQKNKEMPEAKELLPIFQQYEKERRYYKTTLFEKNKDFDQLLMECGKQTSVKPHGKKVLIFEWASITHKESVLAFETLGFECHTYKTPYKSWVYDEDFLEQVNRHLDFNTFDLVFSVNYFAMIAEACHIHDIPYVSWCYDSPTYIGDRRYLKYPTNHVFMFDSFETERYHSEGYNNVHYMPLAVNVSRYDQIICTPEEKEKYKSSISFVGSLYDTKAVKAMSNLTDYQKGYLNSLVDNQLKIYGHNLFTPILSEKFMKWISNPQFYKAIKNEWTQGKDQPSEENPGAASLNIILNKMVTNRERLLLITMLSKHWDFKLYSTSTSEVFKTTIQCGPVEYYQEMPKVFKNSRINLNVTLRSIESGIPQRCIDIMGSHGLLLTNYQKDLEEYFKDQKNILIYRSVEEAYDKCKFYLEHEALRKKIEDKGYETIRKHFNYPDSLKKMLHISELDYLLK